MKNVQDEIRVDLTQARVAHVHPQQVPVVLEQGLRCQLHVHTTREQPIVIAAVLKIVSYMRS